MPAILPEFLDEAARIRFMSDHWLREPYATAGNARACAPLARWDVIERLLATPCDRMVAREGRLFTEAKPRTLEDALELQAEGWSLVLRHAHAHDRRLAEFAGEFAAALHGAIDLQIYATPAGSQGFGWHLDPEEVFIIQTGGTKDYSLRRNTVHRDPVIADMPHPSRFERETSPIVTVRLDAGDWLYIPGGWWHAARAITDSLSISMGVMPPTPLDAVDMLRAHLARIPAWRARLPTTGAWSIHGEEERIAAYRDILSEAAHDISSQLPHPKFIRAFIAMRMDAIPAEMERDGREEPRSPERMRQPSMLSSSRG